MPLSSDQITKMLRLLAFKIVGCDLIVFGLHFFLVDNSNVIVLSYPCWASTQSWGRLYLCLISLLN